LFNYVNKNKTLYNSQKLKNCLNKKNCMNNHVSVTGSGEPLVYFKKEVYYRDTLMDTLL